MSFVVDLESQHKQNAIDIGFVLNNCENRRKFRKLSEERKLNLKKNCIEFNVVNSTVKLPQKATKYSVGYDVYAGHDEIIGVGQKCEIGTGLKIADMPKNIYIQIASRSGMAFSRGLEIFPGIIDPDFLDQEIKILIWNRSNQEEKIMKGERIAQFILHNKVSCPIVHYELFVDHWFDSSDEDSAEEKEEEVTPSNKKLRVDSVVKKNEEEFDDFEGLDYGASSILRVGGFGSTGL